MQPYERVVQSQWAVTHKLRSPVVHLDLHLDELPSRLCLLRVSALFPDTKRPTVLKPWGTLISSALTDGLH